MSDIPEDQKDEPNQTNKKSESHSYRGNNESVKCLLCGYLKAKWHKCPPSYEYSSGNGSRGKLSKRPVQGESQEKQKIQGDNENRGIDDERQRNDCEEERMDNGEDTENVRRKRGNERWGMDFGGRSISPETEMKMKEEAKESYINENFKLALAQYSELIGLFPKNEIYYGNRSACHMMMGNDKKALADAKKSIAINPQFIKGHYRVIKFTLTTGKITELDDCLSELEKINSTDEFLISTRETLEDLKRNLKLENDARERKDNAEALRYIKKCIEVCPSCVAYKLRKARYLAYVECYEEADAIANDILTNNKRNPWAKCVLSIHMYYTDIEKVLPYLEEIIQQSPKMLHAQKMYQKARQLKEMKEKGNEAFRSGEFIKAHGFYMHALKIDPKHKNINKQLYNNMAQASYKLGMKVKSIRECTKALEIDENYLKALVRRGKCYLELNNFSSAIDDFLRCCQIDEGVEYRNLLDEAKKRQEEREREERERERKEEEERKRRESEEEERKRKEREKEEERRRYWEEFSRNFRQDEKNRRGRSNYDRYENERNQKNSDDERRDQREGHKERSSGRRTESGNYYAVLGVNKHASLEEIKTAYLKLAKIHHPDRHANSSKEVKEENELKMKLITEAYRELTEAKESGFEFW